MPLVVTRVGPDEVEVWGQVRPAEGPTRASVTLSPGLGHPFENAAVVKTNAAGYFSRRLRRRHAAELRYRVAWRSPGGALLRSRRAHAGRRIRYRGG